MAKPPRCKFESARLVTSRKTKQKVNAKNLSALLAACLVGLLVLYLSASGMYAAVSFGAVLCGLFVAIGFATKKGEKE